MTQLGAKTQTGVTNEG